MRALFFLLLSMPALAAAPLKLASPGLSLLNLDEKMGNFYTDHLGTTLKQPGAVELVTPREIASLLGMERQKQLLGCSDSSGSCVAELANALGADGVVLGDLAKIGSRFQVNLKIISANDGKTLAMFSEGAPSEEALLDVLARGGTSLRNQTLKAFGRVTSAPGASVVPEVQSGAGSPLSRKLAFIPMGLGVAAVGGGLAAVIVSENASAELTSGTPGANGEATRDRGRTAGTVGLALMISGGALLAGGAVWYLLGADAPPAVTLAPTANGGTLVLSGQF